MIKTAILFDIFVRKPAISFSSKSMKYANEDATQRQEFWQIYIIQFFCNANAHVEFSNVLTRPPWVMPRLNYIYLAPFCGSDSKKLSILCTSKADKLHLQSSSQLFPRDDEHRLLRGCFVFRLGPGNRLSQKLILTNCGIYLAGVRNIIMLEAMFNCLFHLSALMRCSGNILIVASVYA